MTDFKTDNQDKSNLVGDAKLMSDAVDREQEMLKRLDELRVIKEKAKAWGDLEALMDKEGYIEICININGDIFIDDLNMGNNLSKAISDALGSIRGES